jgi:O-antigen/teichoic acid export membrane protein
MFNLLVKIGAFCVFPLAAGMFVLGDKMITIVFKPEYIAAKPILWIIMIFTAVNVFAQPTGLVLKALEKVQIILFSRVFAIYNLIVELLVIQWFGVIGVVLVTCSAIFMVNVFEYHFAKKYAGLYVDWHGLMAISINATVMAICLWPVRNVPTGFLSLILVVSVGLVVYLLCSRLNRAFNHQERSWINRVMPRPAFIF